MTYSKSSRSHVLLTLGTLFAFGGASRFIPSNLATAEESANQTSTEVTQDASRETSPTESPLPDAPRASTVEHGSPDQVCLTGQAAAKYTEDLWLFEAEREEISQEKVKLKLWEAELTAQTTELKELQSLLNTRWGEMQQQAEQDIIHLAKMYASMKAEQAAEIFNQMDPDFAAGFLTELSSEQAGLILANMEKEKAYIVSVSMASAPADIRTDTP
jgi:flagellar motility protein MotE (MotC chaperone)